MRKQSKLPARILPRGVSISPAGFPAPAVGIQSSSPLIASALGYPVLSRGAVFQTTQGAVIQTLQGTLCRTPQGVVNPTPHGIVNQTAYGTIVQTSQGAVLQTTQPVFNQTPLCVENQGNQSLTSQNPYMAGCKKILPRIASTGQDVRLDTGLRKDSTGVSQQVCFVNAQNKTGGNHRNHGRKSKGNKHKQRPSSVKPTEGRTDRQMEDLIGLVRELLLTLQSPVTGDSMAFRVLSGLTELLEISVKHFIHGCSLHQIVVKSETDQKENTLEDLLKTIISKQGWTEKTGLASSPTESTGEECEAMGAKITSKAGDSMYDDTQTQRSQLTKCHETPDTDTDSQGKDCQGNSDTDAHVQERAYHDTDQITNEDIGHKNIAILGTKCQDVDDSDVNKKDIEGHGFDTTDTDSHTMLDIGDYNADLHGGLILKVEDIKMESSDFDQPEGGQSTQDSDMVSSIPVKEETTPINRKISTENNKNGTTDKAVHRGDISRPTKIKDMYKVVQDNPIILQRIDTTLRNITGYMPIYTTAIRSANFVNLGMIPSVVNTIISPASKIVTGRAKEVKSEISIAPKPDLDGNLTTYKKRPSRITPDLQNYLTYLEYHCFLCGPPTNSNIPFESQTHLDNHIFTKHVVGIKKKGDLECPVCNIKLCQKIKSRISVRKACTPLLRHLVGRHKWKIPDYIFTEKCNYAKCKYRATTNAQRKYHMQTHENVLCDACGDFYKRNVATKHLRKCPGNTDKEAAKKQCPVCNKQVNDLKPHMTSHNRIICYVCSQTVSRGSLEMHLFYRHQINSADRPMLDCSSCDYQTVYQRDLHMHAKRFHMAKRLVCCPTCHKMLSELSLRPHIQSVHCDRKFSCPQCAYKAKNATNLRTHLLGHSGTKNHSCDWCPYKTAFKFNLPKHQRKCRHNPKNKM